jgi:uncharacterized spore protein YtfJ
MRSDRNRRCAGAKLAAEGRWVSRRSLVRGGLALGAGLERTALAVLQEKGIQIVPMERASSFSETLESVYREAAGRIGADLVERAHNLS